MCNKALVCLVVAGLTVCTISEALADCQPYWTAEYKCMMGCGCAGGGGNRGDSNYDYGAAQRAQEAAAAAAAAAEAQRQRDAELEQQRIEAENKRRMEEIANQARFIDDRDAAASSLRGSTSSSSTSGGLSEPGLRGSNPTTELRGSAPVELRGSISDTAHTTNLDPMVVDARNVPSGLPKSVDDAIAAGYSGAPSGVSDRVRKGFQAVMTHDWKAAKAWFEDALNHDPNNAGLKRLVALSDYTEKHVHLTKDGKLPKPSPRRGTVQLPKDSDMELLFPGWQPFPVKLSPTRSSKSMHLPKDSDIEFLFPGLPAIEAKEMNDYMFDQALKDAENDPVLIKLSNRPSSKQPKNPYELK